MNPRSLYIWDATCPITPRAAHGRGGNRLGSLVSPGRAHTVAGGGYGVVVPGSTWITVPSVPNLYVQSDLTKVPSRPVR